MLSENTTSYENLVYLFLEKNTWNNLNKTSKLTISLNIRTSKGYSSNFPWFNKIVPNILDKKNFEDSISREIKYN